MGKLCHDLYVASAQWSINDGHFLSFWSIHIYQPWRYYKEEQALPYVSGKTRSIRAPGAAPRDSSNHKHPHIQCCANIVRLATLHPFNTALILYAWQLSRRQNPQLTLKLWYFVVSFRPVQSLLLFIIPPWYQPTLRISSQALLFPQITSTAAHIWLIQ